MNKQSFFNKSFAMLLDDEGGYSDHPDDSGGKTMYGITARTARANGYQGAMHEMSKDQAKSIYFKNYWSRMHIPSLCSLGRPSADLLYNIFQFAVNAGTNRAVKNLQKVCNAFNAKKSLSKYPLKVDGIMGKRTVDLLKKIVLANGAEPVNKAFCCLIGYHYVTIVTKYPKNQSFLKGWLNKRVRFFYGFFDQ